MSSHATCLQLAFNRTIVELKRTNGNNSKERNQFASFNRTIVELKHKREVNLNVIRLLLIEPLWN